MRRRGGSVGFRRLGASAPEGLGLSDARRRRLALEAAWADAVGPALAGRVRCVGMRGGVLTVRAADGAWADAVRRLLPRIAGRLRGRGEGERVRRVRIQVEGRPDAAAEPLPASPSDAPAPPAASRETVQGDPEVRLRAVARRLLERDDRGASR